VDSEEFSKSISDLEKGIEFYMEKLNTKPTKHKSSAEAVVISDIDTISNAEQDPVDDLSE
jgi:hypothetical protein